MKTYTIYKITNILNNKSYVGITSKTVEKRFKEHLKKVKNGSLTKFHQALREYKTDTFILETLEVFETHIKKDAYAKEQSYISSLNTVEDGYNMDCPWNCRDYSGINNPMYGKISGNAHKVSINSVVYNSITEASIDLKLGKNTIGLWLKKNKPNCFRL